ncbi:MAG: alcohol dehydrogenase catalytic domain-containing protein [Hyphomicrobiales bacterium]|nr:alcohol dehydrogenase catalytic domain-containing protein [Hyphomicrobiales bacterium]
MSTMKAAVLVAPGRFDVTAVPVPEVGPDNVLIKIERCGICGTDVHMFNGHYASQNLPLIPGHELAGTIVESGSSVSDLHVGGKAAVDINFACGNCFYCRRNELLNCASIAQLGIGRNGAFAEYVSVPQRQVIAAPEDMPFELLALVEPVACVVRATKKAGVGIGQSAVVLGAGPIGNIHVQLLRLAGAAPIVVLEANRQRAELAREAGADVVAADPAELLFEIRRLTDGRGADIAVECVGVAELYRLAFEAIRPGGHVSAFGLAGDGEAHPLPLLETVLKENSLKGSVAGMGQDMHDAMALLRYRRVRTDAFTGRAIEIDRIQTAFEGDDLSSGQLKVSVVMDNPAASA